MYAKIMREKINYTFLAQYSVESKIVFLLDSTQAKLIVIIFSNRECYFGNNSFIGEIF